MGKAHGYLLYDKIKKIFSLYFSPITAMAGGWIPGSDPCPTIDQMNNGREFLITVAEERCIPAIREKVPQYWEEIQGLYEGLKLRNSPLHWDDVLIGNCMPEAAWNLSQCSNFAAWGKATSDSKLIHGVNLDEETFDVLQDYMEIIIVKPDSGNNFLGMHIVGNISPNSWMNDKGLSYGEMTCNSVNTKWPQIPHLMHGRKVAQEASSIKEAYTILEKTGGTTGWANLIAEGKGENPHAADIEITGTEISVRYEDPNFPNVIWLTNTFRCYPGNQGYNGINLVKGQVEYWKKSNGVKVPNFINPNITWNDVDTLKKWQRNVSCPRYEKYFKMLKKNYSKIDLTKAIDIQSDDVLTKERMVGRIQLSKPCKHFFEIERPIFSHKLYSVYSCIFLPSKGEAWIALGKIPAQEGAYWRVSLPEHLNLF
jgi:hypothetical protein